jgi:hypothetical protein
VQIDPDNQWYGEIEDLLVETEEQRAAFQKAVDEGKVVAVSDSTLSLKQLQDDLRKAGYRKLRQT